MWDRIMLACFAVASAALLALVVVILIDAAR